MRNEIHILWFEDNIQDFAEIKEALIGHVLKFHDKLLLFDEYDHYPEDFDVKLFEGKYSLLFVDLNLNNGQKGTMIIDTLRNNGTFIDTLLYSNNATELMQLTEAPNYVEGVFRHSTMRGIEDKMKSIIDQILYKELMVIERNKE